MLRHLFRGRSLARRSWSAPAGTRVYAIGDIHGRIDLLDRMHELIRSDAGAAPETRNVIVYLGDYIDRGDASRAVIERLLEGPPDGFEAVYLAGNHEDIMLMFLEDPDIGPNWFLNGGDATLYSYGVAQPFAPTREERLRMASANLRQRLPGRHLEFLRGLKSYHVEGDYVFVHAGIRPGRPLDQQELSDLLWIRGPFLNAEEDHGFCVVHGHTIADAPALRANRIGIDTGAYFTGVLSCVALSGTEQRILHT
jgi:diadenosine tetraphosphatase ApaH/serine/threonine PP2A family protein phosphatase